MNYKQFAFRNLRNYILEVIRYRELSYKEVLQHSSLKDLKQKIKIEESTKITTAKQLDEITALELKKKGHKYHVATVENNSAQENFNEELAYSWDQCKAIAELFTKMVADKVDVKIFEALIEDFLRANDDGNTYDIKYEAHKIIGTPQVLQDNPNSELIAKKGDLILKNVQKKIDQAIQNEKFVFLFGAEGCGKKIRADYAANDWYYSENFNYKIRIDCEKADISFADFLKKIWSVFHEGAEFTKSTNVSELMRKAQECLSDDIRFILFINGFDCIKKHEDQQNIISFLDKNVSPENIVILTSTAQKSNFKYIGDLFTEIEVPPCSEKEWIKMAAFYKSKYKIAKDAEKRFKRIAEIAFAMGDGNPKKLKDCYLEICNQIQYEDMSDFNPETNKILFTEIINDLDDACISCLIALSLFSNAVSESTLQKITGLEKQTLSESFATLKDKLLIKVESSDAEKSVLLYSLPNKLQAAIAEEKSKNSEKYEGIFERWIKYFEKLTSFSEITLNNQEKQNELKLLFINIGCVLDFCEEKERWEDYCCLSQMMW